MANHRVISIHKISVFEYHLDVETSSFFGGTKRQQFRGNIGWKRYPQGTELDFLGSDWDLRNWLTSYVQQYEWSREHSQ